MDRRTAPHMGTWDEVRSRGKVFQVTRYREVLQRWRLWGETSLQEARRRSRTEARDHVETVGSKVVETRRAEAPTLHDERSGRGCVMTKCLTEDGQDPEVRTLRTQTDWVVMMVHTPVDIVAVAVGDLLLRHQRPDRE